MGTSSYTKCKKEINSVGNIDINALANALAGALDGKLNITAIQQNPQLALEELKKKQFDETTSYEDLAKAMVAHTPKGDSNIGKKAGQIEHKKDVKDIIKQLKENG